MDILARILISALTFAAAYLLVRHGSTQLGAWVRRMEARLAQTMRSRLATEVDPRTITWLTVGGGACVGLIVTVLVGHVLAGLVAAGLTLGVPPLVIEYVRVRRVRELERQLVDALGTLASGVRAGLNLTAAMELITRHYRGPIQQEFAAVLREYELGMDLGQAMRHAAQRGGSPLLQLAFTAVDVHRRRGGDVAESLDRLATSIRDIHRMEGRLDALTAQTRYQAAAMASMPVVFLLMLWLIDAEAVGMLFEKPAGRAILLAVAALIAVAFVWMRRIMAVDL